MVRTVDPTAAAFPLPEIGVGLASHETPLSQSEIGRIRALNLGHLRADVHLSRSDHEAAFRRAIEQSQLLDLPIHLALFVAPEVADEQLAGLRERLDSASPAVSLFLVYPNRERFAGGTPVAEVVAAARRHLGDLPGARLAAGTNADYIFMARSLPPLDQIDALAFAIHPQEHASTTRRWWRH
jgi:hypothetical protein